MLPVLLHRVGNAAQLLTSLDALLGVDPRALDRRPDDLAAAGAIVDDVGWLLALLASASGARLLLDRRESGGLEPVVACVRACLRREERDLVEPTEPLPLLSPFVGAGWQLPWGIGSLLYLGGRALPPREQLAWTIDAGTTSWRVTCRAPQSADLDPWRAWLDRELPQARLRVENDAAILEVPSSWLLEAPPSP